MTLQPETRLKGRRASISRLISKRPSIGRRDSDEMKRKRMETLLCDPLDLELAKIREQLVSFASKLYLSKMELILQNAVTIAL